MKSGLLRQGACFEPSSQLMELQWYNFGQSATRSCIRECQDWGKRVCDRVQKSDSASRWVEELVGKLSQPHSEVFGRDMNSPLGGNRQTRY